MHEGYETSRRMLRRHDPTYYLATRRLPAAVRPATYALYGYVRTADQLVDGPRRAVDARRSAARRWTPGRPSSRRRATRSRCALDDAAGRHALPLGELRPVHALDARRLRGRSGSPPGRSSSTYMDGSAGTVGRIMAALLGLPPQHHADLGRLGVAFQLANFIRDVREDRRLDRDLPAGRGPRALRRERARPVDGTGPAVRALLAYEVARARALFAAARPAIAAAPRVGPPGGAAGRRPVRADAPRRAPDGRARVAPAGRGAGDAPGLSGSRGTSGRALAPTAPSRRLHRCAGGYG